MENKQTEQSKQAIKEVWNDNFFILFMGLRFPNEQDESYIREWKSRLMTGNPFVYMDKETQEAYKQAIKEYLK